MITWESIGRTLIRAQNPSLHNCNQNFFGEAQLSNNIIFFFFFCASVIELELGLITCQSKQEIFFFDAS